MRPNLFLKFFAFQLVTAVLLVTGTIALLGYFTDRNFADYLRERDEAAFARAAAEVGERYAETGDLVEAAAGVRLLQRSLEGPRAGRRARDSGPPLRGAPIESGGRVVGYLSWPAVPPPQLADAAFTSRQWRTYVLIGCAAVLFAAALAALLAWRAARPIRALSAASAALARRDFTVRLPAARADELGELARAFNRLAAELQGYDTRQRQWLADIAHELRNPLAVLRAGIEALVDGVRAPDGPTLRALAGEVSRLGALVDQLHQLSVAESGGLALTREPVDLAAAATEMAGRHAARFRAAGFDLRTEVVDGAVVPADRGRVESVLGNLLENALRHATPPGPVHVRVSDEPDAVVLAVADAGPGVPAGALPRLFDRLYRVDPSRTASTGGAGLGLAIVRSVMEAHGGSVVAVPSAAGGLEIRCRWPKEPRP